MDKHQNKQGDQKHLSCHSNNLHNETQWKYNSLYHDRHHTLSKLLGFCIYLSNAHVHVYARVHAQTQLLNLNALSNIHSGEKVYKCSDCSYASARKYQLVMHSRTHSGEKPYKCPDCDYASADKSNLVKHSHIHHTPLV